MLFRSNLHFAATPRTQFLRVRTVSLRSCPATQSFKVCTSSLRQCTWFSNTFALCVFAGGLGVGVVAAAAAFGRRGLMSGVLAAQKHLTVSLEIPSKDRSYQWVLQWISQNASRSTQHLGVETTFHQDPASGNVSTKFDYVPSTGRHWITYRRRLIQISRDREKSMIDLSSGQPWETVTLTAVGRNKQIFTDLLNEAKQTALKREEGKTVRACHRTS